MEIKRLLTNLCSKDLQASKRFYTTLFSFNVSFESDWFIHLLSDGRELELGIISETHEVVPSQARGAASGMYLTFVVEDVDRLYKKATGLNFQVTQPPEMTFYGQKRMLLVAPEGTVCDVSSPSNG